MSKTFDIKVKEKEYKKFDKLHIEFSGKDVNYVLMNTLRRIIIQYIPTYAFDKIDITKNTSVFNNDVLRLRISNLPVHNIENDNVQYYQNIINNDLDSDKLTQLTMYVEKKNDSLEIINVTTDDAEFFNNKNKIKSIYKKPLLLIKLKEGEEIKLTTTINLNIGKNNIKYSPVTICVYEEKNDNTFLLKLESTNQIEEYDIIKKACEILIIKLENIMNQLKDKDINDKNEGELIFKGEDHTMGNLLNRFLQDHDNILFSGYKMDHLLINNVSINYKTNGAKNINEKINLTIKNIINIINYIIKILK